MYYLSCMIIEIIYIYIYIYIYIHIYIYIYTRMCKFTFICRGVRVEKSTYYPPYPINRFKF